MEKLTLKNRKPSTPKPETDWRTPLFEIIKLLMSKTAQIYIDRAIDAMSIVYPRNPNFIPEDDKAAERLARREANMARIAEYCTQGQNMEGKPQEIATKIAVAMTNRKQLDLLAMFLEQLVRRCGTSAYFEYSRFNRGTAFNEDIAIANLERLNESHALNGDDGFTLLDTLPADLGEDVAPGEDHSRDAPAATDQIPIAAENAENAEAAAYEVQNWATAYHRLLTNNSGQNGQNVHTVPFAIERLDDGSYRNYTDFGAFATYKEEAYRAKLEESRLTGLNNALEVNRQLMEAAGHDGFNIPN